LLEGIFRNPNYFRLLNTKSLYFYQNSFVRKWAGMVETPIRLTFYGKGQLRVWYDTFKEADSLPAKG
jgi:hypothetical protein